MPEATRSDLLAAARGEAERLNLFVSNLLDMSRLEAGALALRTEWHDVDDLVGSALASLGARARSRRIDVVVPEGLPMIRADFVLLTQALSNVMDNALRYAPEDSTVTVAAAAVGDFVEITVEDEGPGIPEADLEHVFEKFYRVQRGDRTSGTGLGLAICRGIADAHGGRVWAERGARGGARITLRLPSGTPPPVPGDAARKPGEVAS